jgi:hypothetical protein
LRSDKQKSKVIFFLTINITIIQGHYHEHLFNMYKKKLQNLVNYLVYDELYPTAEVAKNIDLTDYFSSSSSTFYDYVLFTLAIRFPTRPQKTSYIFDITFFD